MGNIDQNHHNHNYNKHPGTSSQTVIDARSADSQEVPENIYGRHSVNFAWQDNEKVRLVQIDLEEQEKGRGFVRRIKQGWDAEFPGRKSISKKNLRDNTTRFKNDPDIMRAIIC